MVLVRYNNRRREGYARRRGVVYGYRWASWAEENDSCLSSSEGEDVSRCLGNQVAIARKFVIELSAMLSRLADLNLEVWPSTAGKEVGGAARGVM